MRDRGQAPSAAEALAEVLAASTRLKREEMGEAGDRRDDSPEDITTVITVTTVTTPAEWECEHEWTLRLGGWWGLLEAWCVKCGEVARAA